METDSLATALKALIYRAAGLRFLQAPPRRRSASAIAIVSSHGVHEPNAASGFRPPLSSLPLEVLNANIESLGRHFRFISMDEAVEMISGALPWRQHCVVLTFDDSLKCMAEIVAPTLVARGIPATFYLSTETIDSGRPYWWLRFDYAVTLLEKEDIHIGLPGTGPCILGAGRSIEVVQRTKWALRTLDSSECERIVAQIEAQAGSPSSDFLKSYAFAKPMSWDDAKQLSRLGMTLGSHSATHANLAQLPVEEQRLELESSRHAITKATGVDCVHFCYPYGAFDDVTPSLVSAAGYRSAVTTVSPGWNHRGDDRYLLKRFSMPREKYKLAWLLSGWSDRFGQAATVAHG